MPMEILVGFCLHKWVRWVNLGKMELRSVSDVLAGYNTNGQEVLSPHTFSQSEDIGSLQLDIY
jgi:hypothetical protein